MNQAMLRAPYEYSKVQLALAPVVGNNTQNGPGVDRTGYQSAIAEVIFSASGSPTGGSLTVQLQDSGDDVTFANYGTPLIVPISAQNAGGGVASLGIDVSGARQFIRVVVTGAPTGGASPTMTNAAVLRLFGPDHLPAA